MTLIEVVAGLALLAAVLSLVFAARSHVARQQVRADRRLAAVAAADALLAAWWQDPSKFPRAGGGTVPGRPDLVWRTGIVPNPAAEALGSQAVRLEVTSAGPPGVAGARPVVSVEVVLPVTPPPGGGGPSIRPLNGAGVSGSRSPSGAGSR